MNLKTKIGPAIEYLLWIVLVCGAYTEAGIYTALGFVWLFIRIELQSKILCMMQEAIELLKKVVK